MKWDEMMDAAGDAVARKYATLARKMSDSQLQEQYYSGEGGWRAQEVLEKEMRRRHLL